MIRSATPNCAFKSYSICKKIGPDSSEPPGPPIFLVATTQLTVIVDMNIRAHIIVMMVAVFAAAVMTVDPMMAVLRPMAGNPDHFVVAFPVTRTVTVVWPVTDFDANPRSLKCGSKSKAHRDRREQQ